MSVGRKQNGFVRRNTAAWCQPVCGDTGCFYVAERTSNRRSYPRRDDGGRAKNRARGSKLEDSRGASRNYCYFDYFLLYVQKSAACGRYIPRIELAARARRSADADCEKNACFTAAARDAVIVGSHWLAEDSELFLLQFFRRFDDSTLRLSIRAYRRSSVAEEIGYWPLQF